MSITNPNSLVTSYTYNPYTGNLSRIDNANDTWAEFDFDNLDRLDYLANKKSGGTISSFDYQYNNANLISQVTLAGGSKYQYEYDDLYRLSNEYSLNSQGGAIYTNGFEHDRADNRTGLADGTHEGYTLNALNQIVNIYTLGQQDPHTTFTYDYNGNMTSKTASGSTSDYDYDYENRLVKITYPDNGWTEFVYDALGRLLTTTEKNAQGQVLAKRQYVYDGLDLLAELDGSGNLVAAYTHGPGIDDPLIVRYNGVNYVLHKNHQGSITEITNMSRTVVKTYTYDAYGAILQETGPTLTGGFTYTGRQYHSRSGLYYYRARFYDPDMGRFMNQDPIGHEGGANLYKYAIDNPVNFVDPFGLQGGPMFDPSGGYVRAYGKTPPYNDTARTMERGLLQHGNKFTLVAGGASLAVGGFALVPVGAAMVAGSSAVYGGFTLTSGLVAGGVGTSSAAAGLFAENPPGWGESLSGAVPTALGVPWGLIWDFLEEGLADDTDSLGANPCPSEG